MLERIKLGIDKFYVACGRTDMRMGLHGLINKVTCEFKLNPYDTCAFLFCGRRNDRIKVLIWEGDGFLLMYKRFETGKLQWPRNTNEAKKITEQQLEWLLSGIAIEAKYPIKKLNMKEDLSEEIAKLLA